jgi:hypothetical protein
MSITFLACWEHCPETTKATRLGRPRFDALWLKI